MHERLPKNEVGPVLRLCLDDDRLCRNGPIPVIISSLSETGLAVLTVKRDAGLVDPAAIAPHGGEECPVRLTAHVGNRDVVIDVQLVWSDQIGSGGDEYELIVDAASASEWPAIVAAYQEVV